MEIETLQDLQAAQKLISARMHEVEKRTGKNRSESRRIAATELGMTYRPVLTAAEFESMLGRARSKFYGEKRNAAIREAFSEKHAAPSKKSADKGSTPTFAKLYREWCSQNNHVSGDSELAHFSGKTPAAVWSARDELSKAGYVFTKNGTGYNIAAAPEQPKYTEREWQEREKRLKDIERLLGELRTAS